MDDREVEELQRLWDLKEKGAISEDEYAQLKSQILGQGTEKPSPTDEPRRAGPLPGTDVEFRHKRSGLTTGQAVGIACAGLVAIVFILAAMGSGGGSSIANNTMNVDENLTTTDMNLTTVDMNATAPKSASAENAQRADNESGLGGLTGSQANAVRSAEQYLSMSGFSREGLIDQLSSDAGDGYSVADATAAVDSLSVDWNENAAKSARQYLGMSGFSCQELIEQLSSSAGDKYSRAQATYGAREAGAC